MQTGGAAAADYDNDGWVDLFVTRLDGADVLYRNMGNGTFQNVSAASGFTAGLPTNGPAWGDIDNDGDKDLYVTSCGDTGAGATRFYLYVNDGNWSLHRRSGAARGRRRRRVPLRNECHVRRLRRRRIPGYPHQ